jgi:putative lipoprotein
MTRLFQLLTRVALCCALAGPALAEMAMLEVTVGYRERIALPPDAQLEVELLDVSRMDVAATLIASQRVRMTGVPMRVTLPYDPAVIDDRFTYSVSARLFSDDRVIFRTTQAAPVLTRGAGSAVELILQRMPAPDPAPPALIGTTWVVFEIAGRMLEVERPPTLLLAEGGGLSVFGGCNQFAGQVTLGEGTLAVADPLAGTLMACPDPASRLERDMVAALQATAGYVQTGDVLVLTNAAGVATLRLRPEGG